MRKLLYSFSIIITALLLTGCTPTTTTTSSTGDTNTVETLADGETKLPSGFVQYPGEPTREDTHYYIVEDICGQFTTDFVSNMLGREIIRTEGPPMYSCSYYFTNGGNEEFVMIVLDYSAIGNPTTYDEGAHSLDSIPMANYVISDDSGEISTIYLVLSENKYITIVRNGNLSSEEFLSFGRNIASEIKDYR
jgi:hypothetical protein